jgi:hypothetical protein
LLRENTPAVSVVVKKSTLLVSVTFATDTVTNSNGVILSMMLPEILPVLCACKTGDAKHSKENKKSLCENLLTGIKVFSLKVLIKDKPVRLLKGAGLKGINYYLISLTAVFNR